MGEEPFRTQQLPAIVECVARSSQPGLHDPYWYEAIAGLRYVVDLLDHSTGVVGVTFQKPAITGLDDVVVSHADGRRTGVQVKHTRADAPLTFNDLTGTSGGESLLRKLAQGWKQLSAGGVQCTTRFFSNRQLSVNPGASGRPALDDFWRVLSAAAVAAPNLATISIPPEHTAAWDEWVAELSDLDDVEKLQFLQTLRMDGGQADLDGLKADVIARLAAIFGSAAPSVIEQVFDRLVGNLFTWTTSLRESRIEIHREDVCLAIGIPNEETVGDHDFPPPEPCFPSRVSFVDNLARSLRTGSERVTFLTGPAGCGKTSIVSMLANSTDPAVDLRFYAFRPISPTSATLPQDYSQTATASALWGDLLMQLRARYFVGRLSEADVPARNDLLDNDPARLRENVLRLASKLAEERGQPTIIAIDGLDHAARARTLAPEQLRERPSLLDWLVAPSDIPDGVRFLIAGQPQYDRYPTWLRSRTGVSVVDVPSIATEDIEALLKRKPGMFPKDQIPRGAAIIAELSRGNTLAAVYAAAEAETVTDALTLRARLETRLLQDGLEEYYERIWRAALEPVRASALAIASFLAAALALSSARLTGQLLRGFYPDAALSDADWEQALRALAPIIEEQDGSFAVRHNDVRVFLMAKLQATPGAYATAASKIADYYLHAAGSPAKFADLVRALAFARRNDELPSVFTPSYVIEAWTAERPIAELLDHAEQALAAVGPQTGWETLHEFALGLRTLQQLRAALQWLDERGPPSPIPSCLPSEARPSPRSAWTVAAIQAVFHDAARLVSGGEYARASGLLRRWFGDLSPVEVVEEIKQHPGELNPMEERDLEKTLNGLARAWGRIAQRVGVRRNTVQTTLEGAARTTMAHFYGGWLVAGVDAPRPWEQTLFLPRIWFYSDVEAAVRALATANRWSDVAFTLRREAESRAKFSPRFQIAAAPWALRTGDAAVITAWAQPIANGGFALAADLEHSFHDEDVHLYEAIAFTLGWLEPARPASAISEEGTDAYFARRTYDSGHAALRRHLYATAMVARLERAAAANPLDLGNAVRAEEAGAIVRAFFVEDTDRGFEVSPFVLRQGPRLLERILGIIDRQQNAAYVDAVMQTILARAGERPYDTFLEVLWKAAADRGLNDLLEQWAVRWVGSEGEAWSMDLGDRTEAVRRFAPLARASGLNHLATAAETRLRRSQVGYVGRKEYALATPLEWFQTVARDDPSVWESMGMRLLSISRVASEGGDNRMAVSVEGAVTAAAGRSGPGALWRCLMGLAADSDPALALARTSAADGLIGALEGTTLPSAELRTMWCVGVGCLVWEYERHRLSLQHLRQALLAVAAARGDTTLPSALAAIAPRAFEISGNDQLYYYAERWFDLRSPDEPAPPYLRGAEALIGELRGLPLDEAVARLEVLGADMLNDRSGSSSDLWRAVADTARRLGDTRPANFRDLLGRLLAITRQRTDAYSWTFDGIERAFTALIPLMDEPSRWALCEWMIGTLTNDTQREFWVESAAANLAALCGIRAMATGPNERRSGLERELAAQETWILGPNRDGRPRWPLVPTVPTDETTPQTWVDFGVTGLTQIVSGASGAHRVQAALRGLYALCRNDSSSVDALVAAWDRIDAGRREYLLLLAERIVVDVPEAAASLRPFLESVRNTSSGRQKLEAAVILAASARGGEEMAAVEVPQSANHDHAPLDFERRLVTVGQEMYGAIPLTRGTSAVRQTVLQMASALDLDADILDRAVAGLVGPFASSQTSRRKAVDDALEGEMLLHPSSALDTLSAWAVEEAAAGCLGDVDYARLSQALLLIDEPWVLTRPSAGLAGSDAWPVDKELAILLAAPEGDAGAALMAHVTTGLGDDARVLGAVLYTFTRDADVVFHVETRWVRDVGSLTDARHPTTFGGRTFTYYVDDPFEPETADDAGWLTQRTGGQGLVFHSSVPLTPAFSLWRALGWAPRATDPFTWQDRSGAQVAHLEIWNGPIRGATQDRLYRQPILYRWIAADSAWRAAERMLGVSFRTVSDLVSYENH